MRARLLTLCSLALLATAPLAHAAGRRPAPWTPASAASASTSTAAQRAATPAAAVSEPVDADPDLPAWMEGRVDKDTYLQMRESYVNRILGIPDDPAGAMRVEAINQMNRQLGALGALTVGAAWTPIGPAPLPNGQTTTTTTAVSGRVSAIAVDPTDPNKVYVGAAQGGVYRSLDGGAHWTPIFDAAASLAIGALTLAPSNPTILYVGTGEPNGSCDSFFGVGLYRIDNVDTAPVLNGPFNPTPTTDVIGAKTFTGRSISRILVKPDDPATIFVSTVSGIGGLGCDALAASPPVTGLRGIYRSTNATSVAPSFQKLTVTSAASIAPDVSGNDPISDMVLDPTDATFNTLVCWARGTTTVGDGGIWRSTNALAATPTFAQTFVTTVSNVRGSFTATRIAGVTTMIAATGEAATGTSCTVGSGCLRRSLDGGVTWSAKLAGGGGFCGGQCVYDQPVAIHPANAAIILIGGSGNGTCSRVYARSTNSGASFSGAGVSDVGLHADAHAIVFAPSNNNIVYEGNDGGIFKSTDAGVTWASLNNTGFNATQFQSLAIHPMDPRFTIGGTQDNGTEYQNSVGTWRRADFGDGGFALIDQTATTLNNVTMYHTYFNSTSAGLLGFSRVTQTACATDGEWCFRGVGDNDASIGCEGVVRGTTNGITLDPVVNFYAPMAVGPGTPNTLYYASDRLYRSVNKGDLMTVVSQAPIVVNVPISSIGISPQNDNIRIVGLNDGSVWTDLTGSGTFTNVTAAGFPVSGSGTRYVARTIIDPNNSNTAWVTFGGFGMPAGQHVWKTTNLSGGAGTWAAAGSGIPDVPVNALVVDPTDSNTLYAGTDIGVYVTNDGGANWLPFTTGMPVVAVFDIGIQNASRILRCATHGRGMWDRSLTNPVAVDVALVGTQIHPDRVELLWHSGLGAGTVANIYRRPVPGDWAPLGQVIADNAGGIGYDDRDVAIGHTYEYAVGILSGGAEEVAGYVWVTIPGGALSLEAISPNPTSGRDFSVAFTLASSEPATLEVVDVTGRRLMGRSVGALGPGRHQVRLDERSLDPGVYWVRLSQAGRMASTKASVVR